jgi:hypothetical protein
MKSHGAALCKVLSLVAALGLSALSCYLPVYDPATSLSAAFERRLEKVSRIGPAKVSDSDAYEGYFVPHRVAVPTDGYWIQSLPGYFRARYLYSTANGAKFSASLYRTGSTTLGSGAVAAALQEGQAGASAINRGLFVATDGNSTSGITAMFFASEGATYLSQNASAALYQSPSYSTLIGAGHTVDSSSTDHFSFLFSGYNSSSYELRGDSVSLAATTAFSSFAPNLALLDYSGPTLQPGAFFATENGSSYYLYGTSAADGSVYTALYSALGSPPAVLSGVTKQLSALLSNGDLLARDDLTTILYDAGGAKLATLRTGSLRFVHEYYDMSDLTWYSYFTRPVSDRRDSGGDLELYVDVYRFPTASLASLAD